jgi:hypothetical protein
VNNSPAYNLGYALGPIIFGVVVIAIGIYFGNRLGRKRGDGIFVRWPVGVALAIVFLGVAGQCSQSAPNDQVSTNH